MKQNPPKTKETNIKMTIQDISDHSAGTMGLGEK